MVVSDHPCSKQFLPTLPDFQHPIFFLVPTTHIFIHDIVLSNVRDVMEKPSYTIETMAYTPMLAIECPKCLDIPQIAEGRSIMRLLHGLTINETDDMILTSFELLHSILETHCFCLIGLAKNAIKVENECA